MIPSAKTTVHVMFVLAWMRYEWKGTQSSWESTPMRLCA